MRQRFGLEVALRHVFGKEVAVGILAAHQRCPIPLADGLLQAGRNVTDRQTDAPLIGTVRLRPVEPQHVMKRRLGRLQLTVDGFFSSTSTAISCPRVRRLFSSKVSSCWTCCLCVPAINFMQPETLFAGDIAIHAVATSEESRPQ